MGGKERGEGEGRGKGGWRPVPPSQNRGDAAGSAWPDEVCKCRVKPVCSGTQPAGCNIEVAELFATLLNVELAVVERWTCYTGQ